MTPQINCDVLVVGSGVAGICAALCAAEEDSSLNVMLASDAPLYSGSSFAGSTWGMGLISPGSPDGVPDLLRRMIEIGQGALDVNVAQSFLQGIEPAVAQAEAWGVRFVQPSASASGQREYIPCFDDTHRRWRGLDRASWKEATRPLLGQCGVTIREGWELLDIIKDLDGTVCGAIFFDGENHMFKAVSCGALVLATGGVASLWPGAICGKDCAATAQALAVACGAQVVNLDLVQFMPTLVWPVEGVVFNEKTFRHMRLSEEGEKAVGRYAPGKPIQDLLEQRSGYGPFSNRFASKAIDFAITDAGDEGLLLTPCLGAEVPEFVQSYYAWLEGTYGIGQGQPIRVSLRAQASNGGIRIDENGATGVSGLYAAGECTGGMHGVDRIGGLSSANALVFGQRAGKAAAVCAARRRALHKPGALESALPAWFHQASALHGQSEKQLVQTMERNCGPRRLSGKLREAQTCIEALTNQLLSTSSNSSNADAVAATRRTYLRLRTAQAVVQLALERSE